MASLIEELIGVLDEELSIYNELVKVSNEKTSIIVANDLEKLAAITAKEQSMVDDITAVDNKRTKKVKEIALVLNKNPNTITVAQIVELISKQPEFSSALAKSYEELKKALVDLRRVNEHNRDLLEQSLDMAQISINLLQSMNQAPVTANYSRSIYSGDTLGASNSMFDTKQ